MDVVIHECVFVEEREPNGRPVLPPCLVCGLTGLDALENLGAGHVAQVLREMAMNVPAHLTRSSTIRWLRGYANSLTTGVNDGQGTNFLPNGADAAPDESKGDAAYPTASRPAPAVNLCELRQRLWSLATRLTDEFYAVGEQEGDPHHYERMHLAMLEVFAQLDPPRE